MRSLFASVGVLTMCLVVGAVASPRIGSRGGLDENSPAIQGGQARAHADAGLLVSIAEILARRDDADDGWGWVTAEPGRGGYRVRCESTGRGGIRAIARGESTAGVVHFVEAVFRPGRHVPPADAALAVWGRSAITGGRAILEVRAPGATGKAAPLAADDAVSLHDGERDAPLDRFRLQLVEAVLEAADATAGYRIRGPIHGGTHAFGSPEAPAVVVVEGRELRVDGGATITGAGLLVVAGTWHLDQATIDWTGDWVLLGDGRHGDATVANHHARIRLNGCLVALGGNGCAAGIEFGDDEGPPDASMRLGGALLLLAGGERETARLELRQGELLVEGLVAASGPGTRVRIHAPRQKGGPRPLCVAGAMVVAVPEADVRGAGATEIRLHGNASLQYVPEHLAGAHEALQGLAERSGVRPEHYELISRRELSETEGSAAMEAMVAPAIPVEKLRASRARGASGRRK